MSMRLLLCAALAAAAPLTAMAQAWPSRAVTMITPSAAGGSADTEARLYAKSLSDNTGQPFIVDARPGAGGRLGPGIVAKAAPDGSTLLVVTTSFTLAPSLYKTLPYDTVKDFAPVTLLRKGSTMLIARASFPAKNIAEYLGYARANPGKINFATTGAGNITHLAGAWLHSATNTQVNFIHYKGNEYFADLTANRVDVAIVNLVAGLPQVKAGKLKALALTSLERSPLMPDLDTVAANGVPDFESPSWTGIAAPSRTPAEIVNRINAEFVKVIRSPDISQKLSQSGSVIIANSPEQFRQYIQAELARWPKLVKDLGVELED